MTAEAGGAFERHRAASPDRAGIEGLEAVAGTVGRVARAERGGAEVVTADGTVTAVADEPVCTGDWVTVRAAERDGGDLEIAGLAPRRTALVRQGAGGTSGQVLAANIDEVWIVVAADRPVSPGRLERSAVLVWESGAVPVVVATKVDRAEPAVRAEALDRIGLALPGAAVVASAATTGEGVAELADRLRPGATVALMGASGVGKSTLLNALTGRDAAAVGQVRDSDGKGRHTTSWRHLELTAGGAGIIDTPGLRAVGLWLDSGGVDAAFADIMALAAGCRFGDCAHRGEPDCAVGAAVADGTLDARRVERYHKLRGELDDAADRADERARADATRAARRRRRNRTG